MSGRTIARLAFLPVILSLQTVPHSPQQQLTGHPSPDLPLASSQTPLPDQIEHFNYTKGPSSNETRPAVEDLFASVYSTDTDDPRYYIYIFDKDQKLVLGSLSYDYM